MWPYHLVSYLCHIRNTCTFPLTRILPLERLAGNKNKGSSDLMGQCGTITEAVWYSMKTGHKEVERQTGRQHTAHNWCGYFFFSFAINKLFYLHRQRAGYLHRSVSTTAQRVDLLEVSGSALTSQLLEERLGIKQDIRKPAWTMTLCAAYFRPSDAAKFSTTGFL